jgi:hypothetical protein
MRKRPVAEFVDRVDSVLDLAWSLDAKLLENQVGVRGIRYCFATVRTINLGKSGQPFIYVNVDVHSSCKKVSEQWPEKQEVEGRISKTDALLAQNLVLSCSALFNALERQSGAVRRV